MVYGAGMGRLRFVAGRFGRGGRGEEGREGGPMADPRGRFTGDPATISPLPAAGFLRDATPAPVKQSPKTKNTKSTETKRTGGNSYAVLTVE